MPKKRASDGSYGRQAKTKTIRSLSLEKDVVDAAQKEADKKGISLSSYINEFLKNGGRLSLAILLMLHLTQSPRDWSARSLAKSGKTLIAWVVSKF